MFTTVMIMALELSLGMPPVQAAPPSAVQRTDAHGDPLPAGALLRLGTTRLLQFHKISWVGFAHDGQTVLTANNDNELRWWNTTTGKETAGEYGGSPRDSLTLSADGKKLLCAKWLGETYYFGFVDAVSRQEIRRLTFEELFGPREGWTTGHRFNLSPDGQFLATWDRPYLLGDDEKKKKRTFTLLCVWDMKSGRRLQEWKAGDLFEAEFSRDGKTLFAQERDPKTNETSLRSWEVTSGKERQRAVLPRPLKRYVPQPDGKTMLGLGVDCLSLALFETATGKELRPLVDKGGVIHTFALSPDGKRVAFEQAGRVVVCALDNGKVALTVPLVGRVTSEDTYYHNPIIELLAFSPDGKMLAVANGRRLELWDLASGLPVHAVDDVMAGPLQAVHVHGDHLVFRDMDSSLSLWDVRTGKILRRFAKQEPTKRNEYAGINTGPLDSYHWGGGLQAISPDGRTLAALCVGVPIHLYELATGKRLRVFEGSERATCLAFSPDGKYLAAPTLDARICLWDAATGKPVQYFSTGYKADQQGRLHTFLAVRFSPDGRTLAASAFSNRFGDYADCDVLIWETASGNPRHHWKTNRSASKTEEYGIFQVESVENLTLTFLFAPDGKRVASVGPRHIRIMDLHTGKEIQRLGGADVAAQSAVYTPDGKYLAAGLENGGIRLWDTTTGAVLHDVPAHENVVTALSIPKDGKTLVSASLDGTAIVWDLGTLLAPRPASAKQTKGNLEPLWNDLGNADGEKSLKAMQAFAARPRETVELFEARLQPVAPVNPERIRQWVNDLQTDRFATREKAARELERLGELARPTLEKALAGTATLEMRRRVELLLGKLAPPVSGAEPLRAIRAVEVLERIGTKEARRLLEKLAAGARGPRLTEDARAALERLRQMASLGR